MEIKGFIDEAFNDLRQALSKAKEETRSYNKTSSYIYKPERARFKLVIYGKDGRNRYYYSYDSRANKDNRFTDEYEGLMKLIRVVNKNQGNYKTAVIYGSIQEQNYTDSTDYNYQIFYINTFGHVTTNKAAHFKNIGQDVLLDIKSLDLYGKKVINK